MRTVWTNSWVTEERKGLRPFVPLEDYERLKKRYYLLRNKGARR